MRELQNATEKVRGASHSLVGNELLYPPRKSEGKSGRISCCHESTSSKTSTTVMVHVEYIADVYI